MHEAYDQKTAGELLSGQVKLMDNLIKVIERIERWEIPERCSDHSIHRYRRCYIPGITKTGAIHAGLHGGFQSGKTNSLRYPANQKLERHQFVDGN